jgi:uncharacterized tellurite resistance protein B-like protein
MLRSISEFIAEITSGRHPESFEETDYRLAAAALLVHVAASDNEFGEAERERLREVLAYRFELGFEEADKLIAAAMRADREAVDLYQFTSLLNRALDEQGRKRVVEMMFEVAYADGQLSEFEDNVVWRVAELLHVPSRERVTIRRHMRDEIGDEEN